MRLACSAVFRGTHHRDFGRLKLDYIENLMTTFSANFGTFDKSDGRWFRWRGANLGQESSGSCF